MKKKLCNIISLLGDLLEPKKDSKSVLNNIISIVEDGMLWIAVAIMLIAIILH